MNTENMIDVTGVDLKELAKVVYDLSIPVGLGMLHARPGPLPDKDAEDLLKGNSGHTILSMDYIYGRQCKFHVFEVDDKLFIRDQWYDHTPAQLQELLSLVGITVNNE